ncbi:MAG TPA: polysaccharide deacetylase family protein [Thermoanaerobaculia bacterium]|nr:polysaccharide deacetylase family protein [Thermoanaerobaculia bacterium]
MWIVYFHNVIAGPLDAFDPWLSRLSPEEFARQVELLVRRLRPVPLREILERHAAGEDDPDAVAVTFDDGYRGVLTQAAPILAAAGVPATVFVVTESLEREPGSLFHYEEVEMAFRLTEATDLEAELLGERLPLHTFLDRLRAMKRLKKIFKLLPEAGRRAWHAEILARLGVTPQACRAAAAGREEPYAVLDRAELLRMIDAGWTVGSHTRTHRTLSQLGGDELKQEIQGARADLERHLGLAGAIPLAYPYGQPEHVGPRAPAEAAAAGHGGAFTTVPERVTPASDRFLLPRLEFSELYQAVSQTPPGLRPSTIT